MTSEQFTLTSIEVQLFIAAAVLTIALMLLLAIDSVYRAIVPLPKHRAWRWYHRRW